MHVELAGVPHRAREVGGEKDEHGEALPGGSARRRLVAAVVAEVAEMGYLRAEVGAVCLRAGVSRAAFAAEFSGLEECFRAACQEFADALVEDVRAALHGTRDWREGLHAGLSVLLGHLADHATAARACLVEGLAAGPAVLAVRDVTMRTFADLVDAFQASAPCVVGPNSLVSEASVGGVYGIILRHIREGDAGALPGMASMLAYFLLAPIVGCPQARLEVESGAWGR